MRILKSHPFASLANGYVIDSSQPLNINVITGNKRLWRTSTDITGTVLAKKRFFSQGFIQASQVFGIVPYVFMIGFAACLEFCDLVQHLINAHEAFMISDMNDLVIRVSCMREYMSTNYVYTGWDPNYITEFITEMSYQKSQLDQLWSVCPENSLHFSKFKELSEELSKLMDLLETVLSNIPR